MSKQDKVVTLPGAQEIIERLKKVSDDPYMAEKFYPMIAEEARRELVAQGIVMMLTLKIYDFVASGYPEVMANLLHMYVPRYIDALVDDKEVAEAAKRFHQEAIDATRKG